ncbi:MAG: histidine kinase dimerization/phosphoacceptor domain -containing protein [Rhodospirillaceae bacterium]
MTSLFLQPAGAEHLAPPNKVPTAILLMLAGLLIVAAVGGWVAFIAADYARTIHNTQAELTRLTGLLQEHMHRTIEASDLVLQRLIDHLEERDLNALRSTDALHRKLDDMVKGLPQVGSLRVMDASGAVVASSLQREPTGDNFADRDYFRAHAANTADGGPYIGEIINDRQTGLRVFSITRALRSSDGTFRGVVVAFIYTDYFQSFYKSLGLGNDGSITIMRRDGALLVREPLPDNIIGIRIASPDKGLGPDTPATVTAARSPFDANERIIARRLVVGYPLVVFASRTTKGALANWRDRALESGLAGAAVTTAGMLLAVIGLRALRRQRTMGVQLREAHATLEKRVQDRTARLTAANLTLERTVAQRNLLLREVYHRVKNNLQQVDALIALQNRTLRNNETQRVLNDVRLRINALGMVHQQLMQTTDLETFSLRTFLQDLCASIAYSVGAASRGIGMHVEADAMPVDLDLAIPLGLLVNELIANAFRHAFPDGREGMISVQARVEGTHLIVTVADDGVGYDTAAPTGDSAGSRIIEALSRQLRADVTVATEHGTRCVLSIPLGKERVDA